MKRLIFFILIAANLFLFSSCEKDEIGGTATEEMAGEWFVVADAVDAEGNVVYEDADLFGIGHFHLDLYNTAADTENEMWIDDNGNFWEFKTKVNVDLQSLSFASEVDAENQHYESQLTVSDGRILKDAATTPSGMPADSIVFIVSFNDDPYPDAYGYSAYRVSGFRYTGFVGDE